VAICGYRLGYQRQLGADALLTFVDICWQRKTHTWRSWVGGRLQASASKTAKCLVTGLETLRKLLAKRRCG